VPSQPVTQDETIIPIQEVKAKKVRKQRYFVQNLRLRIDRLKDWQDAHPRPIIASGFFVFLASTYVLIQTYIFIASSPVSVAEDFMYRGITHQKSYFDKANPSSNVKNIFPERFMENEASTASEWSTQASWNGWLGKSEISISPRNLEDSTIVVNTRLTARYVPYMTVFRKIVWQQNDAAATIKLDYPSERNLAIYINGSAAGTTSNPLIPKGNYRSYPGNLEITFYNLNTGESIPEYSRFFNIGTTGTYNVTFN
jgi:hypothetical protein